MRTQFCRTTLAMAFLLVMGYWNATQADDALPAEPERGIALSAQLPNDRNLELSFEAARQALANGETSTPFETLQKILNNNAELFVKTNGQFSSLRTEIDVLLEQLPAAQRRKYVEQFGPLAERDLLSALGGNDLNRVRAVVIRYRNTPAGLRALHHLAASHFDHAQFWQATSAYHSIISHPLASKHNRLLAQARLVICHQKLGELSDAEKYRTSLKTALATDAKFAKTTPRPLVAWIEQKQEAALADNPLHADWRLSGGTPNRTAITNAPLPTLSHPRWQTNVAPASEEAALISDGLSELHEQGVANLTIATPLLVGQRVFARTPESLLAIDKQTGRTIWRFPRQSESEDNDKNPSMLQNAGFRQMFAETRIRQLQVGTLEGSLSSDGKRIFAIHHDKGPLDSESASKQSTSKKNKTETTSSVLSAFNLETGDILWRVDQHQQTPLDAFLGPPLPLDNSLYIIGQQGTSARLLSLNSATGAEQWSLPLVDTGRKLSQDTHRRDRACPIAYGNGMLFCPTAAGAIVAVNLATRNPVWAFRYERQDLVPPDGAQPGRFTPNARDRWWKGWRTVGIASKDNSLLLASPESDFLYAFDATNGKLLWEQPRQGGLFLAGIFNSQALVVERYAVRAFDLKDGRIAWTTRLGEVAGQGYATASHYHLPIAAGGIASISLQTGEWRRTFTSPGESRGSLVGSDDGVLLQSDNSIAFLPSIKQTLAARQASQKATPDNRMLALETAELEREQGNFSAAEQLLQAELAKTADKNLQRELLRTLLLHLSHQPAEWKTTHGLLTPLANSTADEIDILHATARAAQNNHDRLDALQLYFELLSHNPSGDVFGIAESRRSVRYDRQLQGEILDLLSTSPLRERKLLEAAFEQKLEQARQSADPFRLQRFADRFSHTTWGQQARTRLSKRTGIGVGFLPAHLQLLEIAGNSDPTLAASAVGQLGQLMHERRFFEDAAVHFRHIEEEFTQQLIDDEKTGNQLLAELPEGSPLRGLVETGPKDAWPENAPQVIEDRRRRFVEFYPIPIDAPADSLLSRVTVSIDRTARTIRFRGTEYTGSWNLSLPPTKSPFRYMYPLYQGWGHGHLLVLRVGTELYGITPLDAQGEPRAKIVWTIDTLAGRLPKLNQLGVRALPAKNGFGPQRMLLLDEFGQPLAEAGPVRPGYFCYRQKGKLIAVDSATSSRLWERLEVAPETLVTGDDEHLILYDLDSPRVEILRAVDGMTVAVHNLDWHPEQFLSQSGRYAIVTKESKNEQTLQQLDLVSNTAAWQVNLPITSTPFAIDKRLLGVVNPSGELMAIDQRTGDSQFTVSVDVPQEFTQVVALADSQRIYVFLSEPTDTQAAQQLNRVRGGFRTPILQGRLVAIDRRSKKTLWSKSMGTVAFPLEQPLDTPFLITYRGTANQAKNGKQDKQEESLFQIWDRRNGTLIHEQHGLRAGQSPEWSSDADQGRIELVTPSSAVRFEF